MRLPPEPPWIPPAARSWTFGQWRDWLNGVQVGLGDQWIAWLDQHLPFPYASVPLNSATMGPGNPFSKNPNTAAAWLGGWVFDQTSHAIVNRIRSALVSAGNSIQGQIAPGVAAGLNNPFDQTVGSIASPFTGLSSIGDFFSRLTQSSTWIRIGEVILGMTLFTIGVNALLKSNDTYQTTLQTGKKIARATTPQGRLFK